MGVSDSDLVLALGPGWVACSDALPWGDHWGNLHYVVYSPAYGGDLFSCRFKLFDALCWWSDKLEVGIGGVTHWRLAGEDDQDIGVLSGRLPGASSVDAQALAQLKCWWSRYCAYRGISERDGEAL